MVADGKRSRGHVGQAAQGLQGGLVRLASSQTDTRARVLDNRELRASARRDMMTENMDTNPKNLLADLGVETDEAQGLAVSEFQQLVAKRSRH